MSHQMFRSPLSLRVLVSVVAGVTLYGAVISSPRAAEGTDFVLPDSDGYGIAECMKPGMACGPVIADAWCEAHGHGHASAFGLSDDVTGSTKISATSAASSTPVNTVLIHCGD